MVTFNGTNNFIGNTANNGGVIAARVGGTLTFHGTNNFVNNTANNKGGAIYTLFNTVLNFTGTSNFIGNHVTKHNGGAICTLKNVALTFNGTNNFISNSANMNGGAIDAITISLTFIGNSNFTNNSAQSNGGGAISALENVSLSFTGTSNFSSNSAKLGGAICAIGNSKLTFNGDNRFTNNRHSTNEFNIKNGVSHGGAMYLAISSLFILPYTTVHWENNHANLGGAVYVSDINPSIYCTGIIGSEQFIPKKKCFFQLPRPGQNLSGVQLVLKNNFAESAGSALYGGAIDNCELNGVNKYSSGEVFDMLIINNDPDNNTSNISSDPIKICLCKNNLPKCWSVRVPYLHRVYPGETFQISVVAVGQRNGPVSSTVRSDKQ